MRYWDAVKNRFFAVKGSDGAINTRLTGSYVGYSTDDKATIVPNPQRNDDFLELDTGDLYVYDGTNWVVFPE